MGRFLSILIGTLLLWGVFLGGAVSHESDMARNFQETGDAKAWFHDIKCVHEPVK